MLYGTESFNQSFQKKVQYEKDERRVGWKQREEEIYVSSTLHDQAKKKGGG